MLGVKLAEAIIEARFGHIDSGCSCRGFRELRHHTRRMHGFGSYHGAANFHLLWMLKKSRSNGRHYLNGIPP